MHRIRFPLGLPPRPYCVNSRICPRSCSQLGWELGRDTPSSVLTLPFINLPAVAPVSIRVDRLFSVYSRYAVAMAAGPSCVASSSSSRFPVITKSNTGIDRHTSSPTHIMLAATCISGAASDHEETPRTRNVFVSFFRIVLGSIRKCSFFSQLSIQLCSVIAAA